MIWARQIGWGTEANLMWQIGKKLDKINDDLCCISTTTTTTTLPSTTTTSTTDSGPR